METLSRYRHVIMSVLSDLAEASAQSDVEILPLFDTARDNYLMLDAGIPKEAIVLAFYSPQKRPLTEFAVA